MGEVSACFSHEVMNPLASLKGYIRLIEQLVPEDHPIRSQLAGLKQNSDRIEDLARSMLNFGRSRTRKVERCKVADLVGEALQFVRPSLQYSGVSVDVKVGGDCPDVAVEQWQIVHALVNLLQNAVDAMAGLYDRRLTVAAGYDTGFVIISVTDTGRGISPADLRRVFTPFFTTKGDKGTGLGLYVTRRAVEEHSGAIALKTGEQGTVFRIGLPA
jgi:signal transduction histidine kinase